MLVTPLRSLYLLPLIHLAVPPASSPTLLWLQMRENNFLFVESEGIVRILRVKINKENLNYGQNKFKNFPNGQLTNRVTNAKGREKRKKERKREGGGRERGRK